MAQPTIRLKKTEMPMNLDTSRGLVLAHELALEGELDKLYAPLFLLDGEKVTGITSRQQTDLRNNRTISGTLGMELRLDQDRMFFKKVLNIESMKAPWVWPIDTDLSGTGFVAGSNRPDIWDWNEDPHTWLVPLTDLETSGTDMTVDEWKAKRKASKIWRTLKRYTMALTVKCIRQGIPVRFEVGVDPNERDLATQKYHVAAVEMVPCTAWVKTETLRKTWLSAGSQPFLPAKFLPELAIEAYRKNQSDALIFIDMVNTMVTARTPYFNGNPTTLPSAWISALLAEEPVDVKDIISGGVPIPPSVELASIADLLAHLEDLKKVTRTLMRMTDPYDHISFLPVDP